MRNTKKLELELSIFQMVAFCDTKKNMNFNLSSNNILFLNMLLLQLESKKLIESTL